MGHTLAETPNGEWFELANGGGAIQQTGLQLSEMMP
jgi:hypothetical protein